MLIYKVVTGNWLTFESSVNDLLRIGWQMRGELKVTTWLFYFTEYHQVMTKEIKEN